ncbi:MAG: alpha/beta hydrolase [Rhodocyclaceae bacterium]|nr:MAG: alpha/beta hydrolase [Rhodocyclaceae bacterium]
MSTWIFLRGLTRESRHWGNFPEVFRGAIADADVVALDLPGNGRLNRMDSPTDVQGMADYCHAEIMASGRNPPFFLLAMSLGAMVAVALAKAHPESVAGCVLINTSLRPYSPFHHRLRPANYPQLLRRAVFGDSSEEWEAMILNLTSNRRDDAMVTLKAWNALRQECPVSRRNAMRQLWAASRYRVDGKPTTPVLILASTMDRLVNPRCSRRLALRWKAHFAEHATAGHDLPLDDAVWVAAQVRDWLTRRDSVL